MNDSQGELLWTAMEDVVERLQACESRLTALERRALEAHWPSLEDMPDGRDVFANVYPVSGAPDLPPGNVRFQDVFPVHGTPQPQPGERLCRAADGYVESEEELR